VPAPVPAQRVQSDVPAGDRATEQDLVQALTLIVTAQFGSTPMIQRKMRIEFGKACRIMDRLEQFGMVGEVPPTGAARPVLVATEELDESITFVREQLAAGR